MSVVDTQFTSSRASQPRNVPDVPVKPADPTSPREVENPGDPGPTVLVPPEQDDPRENPKIPSQKNPPPGI